MLFTNLRLVLVLGAILPRLRFIVKFTTSGSGVLRRQI
ncbi:hypothetical protein CSUNSWCD_1682 [Campylobacter showae CSUNSWCD]|uniref:Uncharacterized protein n=1 Tax=Campylobacter showae CSUNSWCD TaxID=1244083 RepID=M5IQS7_9BACT|nr:hypothetical protein CSUNSWCD_1682 [Campylobacter showae CSUNSWCD]